MTLDELRNQIDVLDRQLVELLSERARAAQRIGHLKAATQLPVYEPCLLYTSMGDVDMERQELNVLRMRLLGAEVRGVSAGSKTLKLSLIHI